MREPMFALYLMVITNDPVGQGNLGELDHKNTCKLCYKSTFTDVMTVQK